jgi:hypothetical protein
MKRTLVQSALIAAIVALLVVSAAAWAQTAPTLGQADQFGALGNSGVTGAAGTGVLVSGDVGSSPTASISNFPPSSTVPPWIVHLTDDGVVQQAHTDAIAAYNNLAGQVPVTQVLAAQLAGQELISGIYSFESAADLAVNGTLTLNGGGVFVFQVPSELTANVGSQVVGTADACSVFWQIGTSATLNGNLFKGTVIADASITLGDGADLIGRALAGTGPTGAVTMAGDGGNTIGGCSSTSGGCPEITLSPSTLPQGTQGVPYSQQITASGGKAPYTFTVSSGTLPTGLTLSASGLLSGTPTTVGSTTVTIQVTDDNGCLATIDYTIVIVAGEPGGCPEITLSPPTLPQGIQGDPYSQQITASGGKAPYTFTVSSGTLPTGLTLSASGLLSGTPTTIGSKTVTIQATDDNGCIATIDYTIVVVAAPPAGCPVIVLSPSTLPAGTVGTAYSQQITASGGTAPYTFTVTSGTLPAGLTLSSVGLLSGTPTTVGSSTVTIRATDSEGCFKELVFTIAIRTEDTKTCPPITLSPATLPAGVTGVPYSQQITASGGTGPYTFLVISGTLPAGLTLSSSGLLSGTPTIESSATITIEAIDANGCPARIVLTVDILLGVAVPTLPQAFVVLLALGLGAAGASRLRRRIHPA